jgi:hypothetical protein
VSHRKPQGLGHWAAPGVAAIGLALSYALFARTLPASGDETFYLERAPLIGELLAELLRGDGTAASATVDQIVASGWFMPGMSILLAPAVVVTDSVAALRLYVGAVNLAMLCGILRLLRASFGARAEAGFLALCLVVPYYGIYSFLFWGDLLATQGVLLLGLYLTRRIGSNEGRGLPVGVGAALAAGLAALTYVRGHLWLCLPLLVLGVFFSSVGRPLPARLRHVGIVGGVCVATFVALLAPWSIAVSQRHGPHLTTTSTATSQIMTFGSDEYLQSVPVKRASGFRVVEAHIRRRAEAAGVSYAVQARVERDRAIAGVTLEDYGRRVSAQLRSFFLDSDRFIERFRRHSRPATERTDGYQRLYDATKAWNRWTWRLLLLAGTLLFLIPIAPERSSLPVSMLFKYMVFVFTLQPFTVMAHGRYYVQYVPYVAMAIVAVASIGPTALRPRRPRSLDEALIAAGQVVALAFGALVLGVGLGLG